MFVGSCSIQRRFAVRVVVSLTALIRNGIVNTGVSSIRRIDFILFDDYTVSVSQSFGVGCCWWAKVAPFRRRLGIWCILHEIWHWTGTVVGCRLVSGFVRIVSIRWRIVRWFDFVVTVTRNKLMVGELSWKIYQTWGKSHLKPLVKNCVKHKNLLPYWLPLSCWLSLAWVTSLPIVSDMSIRELRSKTSVLS